MKYLLIYILFLTQLFSYQKLQNDNFVEYRIKTNFEDIVYALEDEMITDGFILSYRSNIGKVANTNAKYYKKPPIFINAKKLGFCKNSLGYKLLAENKNNILYCPISIAIYESSPHNVILLYQLAQKINTSDTSVDMLNQTILELLENVIDGF